VDCFVHWVLLLLFSDEIKEAKSGFVVLLFSDRSLGMNVFNYIRYFHFDNCLS
jgi:hypothetical protein